MTNKVDNDNMISTDDDKIQKLKDRWEEKTRKSESTKAITEYVS